MESSRREFVLGVAGAALAACGGAAQSPPATPVAGSLAGPAASGNGIPLRPFGKTGVDVSMIGLGGFHIGKVESEDESIRLIHEAVDNGITFMDNCWDYNEGQSEVRMGKALAGGYRQRVFLMTKLDGRTSDAAMGQLEQSLQRLQTDMIDLVQIHEVIRPNDPQRCFAPGGAIETLVRARDAGKLRYIGFTGHKHPDIHLAMLDAADKNGFRFDAVQMPLNVMDAHFESFEARVLPTLVERNIAVLGMKSMGSGDILASGVVKADECLRYALGLPTTAVITGIDSSPVLDQALRVGRTFIPFTSAERSALLARTLDSAQGGKHELFKTSEKYDGTAKNPHWLERAEL
ncbi:MAG TPA: aldo/keto reductase [Polyangiaceae bacterium]|nr:aldo/keto reductase [Polyangiaceae bacterium]